jgi:hypothetical protein
MRNAYKILVVKLRYRWENIEMKKLGYCGVDAPGSV